MIVKLNEWTHDHPTAECGYKMLDKMPEKVSYLTPFASTIYRRLNGGRLDSQLSKGVGKKLRDIIREILMDEDGYAADGKSPLCPLCAPPTLCEAHPAPATPAGGPRAIGHAGALVDSDDDDDNDNDAGNDDKKMADMGDEQYEEIEMGEQGDHDEYPWFGLIDGDLMVGHEPDAKSGMEKEKRKREGQGEQAEMADKKKKAKGRGWVRRQVSDSGGTPRGDFALTRCAASAPCETTAPRWSNSENRRQCSRIRYAQSGSSRRSCASTSKERPTRAQGSSGKSRPARRKSI